MEFQVPNNCPLQDSIYFAYSPIAGSIKLQWLICLEIHKTLPLHKGPPLFHQQPACCLQRDMQYKVFTEVVDLLLLGHGAAFGKQKP